MKHAWSIAALAFVLAAFPAGAAATDGNIPPSAGQAPARLETSPRHGEWADVEVPGEKTPVRAWVVYPERPDKAPVVIVIHEIYGLTDWLRGVADQLAQDGFIAVAPDLLSGKGPDGGGTSSFGSRDGVVGAIRALTSEEVTRRLDATRRYALSIPSATGKIGVMGFCWGGSASFAYATAQPALDAAVVFYGSSPETAKLDAVEAPVLGLYGGDDARVTATIDAAKTRMKELGKVYEVEIYEGAGHGFLRAQEDRDGANRRATEQAWPRVIRFLDKNL